MARVDAAAAAAWCSRSRTSSRSRVALARALDAFAERWRGAAPRRGRRHYDVPADHFTRYDLGLMREQAGALARARCAWWACRSRWGFRSVDARASSACRARWRSALLQTLDALARAARRRSPTSWCSRSVRAARARSTSPVERRGRCRDARPRVGRDDARAALRARARARASGCSSSVAIPFASASGSPGGTSTPPPPVPITSGSAPARRRDDRRAAGHRLGRGQAEALVERGHHDERRAPVEPRRSSSVSTRPVMRSRCGAAELARAARARRSPDGLRRRASARTSGGSCASASHQRTRRPCSGPRRGRRRGARPARARRSESGRNSSVSSPLPSMRSRSGATREVAPDLAARSPATR